MIDKNSLLKVRVDCIWNLFLKMGYSTKCYYCRLWDFKLVDVAYNGHYCSVIFSEKNRENGGQMLLCLGDFRHLFLDVLSIIA